MGRTARRLVTCHARPLNCQPHGGGARTVSAASCSEQLGWPCESSSTSVLLHPCMRAQAQCKPCLARAGGSETRGGAHLRRRAIHDALPGVRRAAQCLRRV